MDLRNIQLVRAIDAQGSLVRAARGLRLCPSWLTRGLAALEARLKGPLFTSTSVTLSEVLA